MTVKRMCPKCDYDLGLHGKESEPIHHKYCDSCNREFALDTGYEIGGFGQKPKHYCSWSCIDPNKQDGKIIDIQFLGETKFVDDASRIADGLARAKAQFALAKLDDRDFRINVVIDK